MRPTYHLLAFIRSSLWNQEALKLVKLDDQMPALQVTETGFLFLQEFSSNLQQARWMYSFFGFSFSNLSFYCSLFPTYQMQTPMFD